MYPEEDPPAEERTVGRPRLDDTPAGYKRPWQDKERLADRKERKALFLASMEKHQGRALEACEETHTAIRRVHRWALADPAFQQAFRKLGGGDRPMLQRRAGSFAADKQLQEDFLRAFAELGTQQAACRVVGVDRRSVANLLQSNEAFAEAFADARDIATDTLEEEARKRATEGASEDVYYQGKVVGIAKKRSDLLLLAMLNAYRPEKFKQRTEHTGPSGGPITVVHVSYDHNMRPDDMPDTSIEEKKRRALPGQVVSSEAVEPPPENEPNGGENAASE